MITRTIRRQRTAITKESDVFVITFDSDGVADTIKRNGVLISAAHRDARVILNNAETILGGGAPKGFMVVKS